MIYRLPRKYSASEFSKVLNGKLIGEDCEFECLSIDSREKNPGGVFAALIGERFDAHDFIDDAIKNGASLVIVDRDCSDKCSAASQILVKNTTEALGAIGSMICSELSPMIVAITGSVGKTTTKQLIYSLLSTKYETHKTEGNLNNQIGLPLTLTSLREEHKVSVLEFGMSAKGEISYLSKLVRPDIAVITNIGSSHLEHLGTRENIRDAKLEIIDGLRDGGVVFLNGDEPLLAGIEGAKYVSLEREDADVYVEKWSASDENSSFDIRLPNGKVYRDLIIPSVGRHVVFDAAFACAVADHAGLSEEEIRRGLIAFRNTGLRQHFFTTDCGGVSINVIADCYNASPESMKAALEVLCLKNDGFRKIAVLGEMRELGENSAELHKEVGRFAAKAGVDALFTFGSLADEIASGAREAAWSCSACSVCETYSFTDLDDPDKITDALRDYVKPGDTLLFKASRAVEMERIVNRLNK